MIIRKVELNGSQLLAKERRIRAKKLRGGPGMMGKIHPTRPMSAKSRPRMINAIAKVKPPADYLR
jgi:hypothetical protein